MSGRTLRRLPVLSYARYMSSLSLATYDEDEDEDDDDDADGDDPATPRRRGFPIEDWLDALERVVRDEGVQKDALERLVGTGGV